MITSNNRQTLLETAAIQIVAVLSWLWVVPVIDSLDSYSYGTATRALILSLIPFVIGAVAAVRFSGSAVSRLGRYSLIISSILLLICIVLYSPLYKLISWSLVRYCRFLGMLGFLFLGYGLNGVTTRRHLSFKSWLVILIALYIIYNLLVLVMNNIPSIYMPLYQLANMAYGLVRIAIVVVLWKTLSVDSVKAFICKFSNS